MVESASLSCGCGTVRGTLRDIGVPAANHVVCYCSDCRAYARHLGQEGRVLDAQGGTAIYQTHPDAVAIERGADRIAALRMTSKGPYRWYAACCDTPLCNTLSTPKLAFTGVIVAATDAPDGAFGPVRFRHKPEQARGPVPDAPNGIPRLVVRNVATMVRDRLNGRWRGTPFFDAETGRPIAEPRALTKEERRAAYGDGAARS